MAALVGEEDAGSEVDAGVVGGGGAAEGLGRVGGCAHAIGIFAPQTFGTYPHNELHVTMLPSVCWIKYRVCYLSTNIFSFQNLLNFLNIQFEIPEQ